MEDSLQTFARKVSAAWGPLTTELVAECRRQLEALLKASTSEAWLAALHAGSPPNEELYRDPAHGFVLLAHPEQAGLYRPPHDHGRGWVIYAMQQGEIEMGTYARVEDGDGRVRLVKRDSTLVRAGQVQVYLPGDIHDTRCMSQTALVYRFTERDLRVEDRQERRVTRYVQTDGVWTPGDATLTVVAVPGTIGPEASATGLEPRRRIMAVAAVLSSMALVVLDAGIANVALPTIAGSLQTTAAGVVLVITAYQAALVMALLPCGALGERYGYRTVFAYGVALFTLASVLCALAPSLSWLVVARFIQGLGGAAIMSLGVALLRFSVPTGRLGSALGWNATTVALCSAAGPATGALVLTHAGWPWLFALNLPLGVAVLLATRALPRTAGRAGPVDLFSILLNALLFAALIGGAEVLPTMPMLTAGLLFVAGLALWGLIRRETPKVAPMVPLDLLRLRGFRTSVIASVCCFGGQTAALVALPFHLHNAGLTPLEIGLYMTAWPLSVAITAMAINRLTDGPSSGWLCVAGGVLLAAGLAGASLWPLNGDARPLIVFMALSGLGFGLFQTPNNRNMFLAAPPERSGAAGGMQGTARLTGQTMGAVLTTLIFATASPGSTPRIAFGVGAMLALAAGLVSLSRTGANGALEPGA